MSLSLKKYILTAGSAVLPQSAKERILRGPLRKHFIASGVSNESAADKRTRQAAGRKPVLHHLDVHITDHCNLNCKGCEHYSSIAKPAFADLGRVKRDLTRLAELFENINHIYLLGGEPLLHDRVADFILITREIFPHSNLALMSNGLLVTRMNDEVWEALAKTGTTLLCDSYPINIDTQKIEDLGHEHGVRVEWMPAAEKFFKIPLDITRSQDAQKSFNRCRGLSNCAIIRDGKIYGCAHIAYSDILQDEFGEQMSLDCITPTKLDYIDIYKESDGDKVIERLMSPVPWCGHCDFDSFSTYQWGRTNRAPEEWFKVT